MYGIITTVNKARLGAVRWQNRARRSRDAVKEELRMKKRNRLTICLVAGVLILADLYHSIRNSGVTRA